MAFHHLYKHVAEVKRLKRKQSKGYKRMGTGTCSAGGEWNG